MLDTYKIVVIVFLLSGQANWVKSFGKTFLLANINLEIDFRMSFIILSSINVVFLDRKLLIENLQYSKIFLTTKYIKLVRKKEFIIITLHRENLCEANQDNRLAFYLIHYDL